MLDAFCRSQPQLLRIAQAIESAIAARFTASKFDYAAKIGAVVMNNEREGDDSPIA
ncbi:MAG: hypothetical protein F6J95_016575 [Leptolyngbya sp. SIO1E4]|nr:hypothetical protein [Leptolyngbya sp. SIO1E4]